MTAPVCRAVGEAALLVSFGNAIDEDIFARVVALDRALAAAPPPGLIEAVPAYTTLLIVFDPLATDHDALARAVGERLAEPAPRDTMSREHVIEIHYDGDCAPDLKSVAAQAGLSREAVIAAHLGAVYRVVMYGFAPGYAYLGGVPEALRLPRKPAAVRGIPVGSVMIAGAQCLITTLPMPTGWWVIGRTGARVLDAASDRPFLFEPGDTVRFVRVDRIPRAVSARLRIEQAGPLTTVQDAGRPRWRRFGVPPSGPADRLAFAAAHVALGNPASAAAIELSLGGLTLRSEEGEIVVALAGGGFVADIDGVALGGWTTTLLAPGMRLRIRERGDGNWGYFACAGDLVAPTWLGSRSTHALAGLGGGRLAAGDIVTIDRPRATLAIGPIMPLAAENRPARIVLGPQQRFFSDRALALLTDKPFAATARFDRMGMALDGPALPPTRLDMPSEPIVRGALQVDGDGRLSLLTADHQTTGGYPRIATVIGPDVDRLAQAPAGALIRFVAISPGEAVSAARGEHAAHARYLETLARDVRDRLSLFDANLIGGVVDALGSIGDAEIEEQHDEQHRGDQREIKQPE